MAKAEWNGEIVAESDTYEIIDGNVYFPRSAIKYKYFIESNNHTTCFWKGVASYYTLEVNGEVNPDAAWYYPDPSDKAARIKDHIAFWKGVKVTR
ncbi:MAG: DUF427 domain-containing protein [Candidatus Kariarchaeaceae archaeon]|jgi:uncharacterized protein (DUF427 family)